MLFTMMFLKKSTNLACRESAVNFLGYLLSLFRILLGVGPVRRFLWIFFKKVLEKV